MSQRVGSESATGRTRLPWRVANKVPGLEELQVEPRRMNLMYTHTEVQGMPDAMRELPC